MPVTPPPETILLDLPEEYLDFLDKAARKRKATHKEILRDALALLKMADAGREWGLAEGQRAARDTQAEFEKAHLAAWDRWSAGRSRQLPLSGDLADFVTRELSEGGYEDATAVVMLALLRYAKVMGFLGGDEDEGS